MEFVVIIVVFALLCFVSRNEYFLAFWILMVMELIDGLMD